MGPAASGRRSAKAWTERKIQALEKYIKQGVRGVKKRPLQKCDRDETASSESSVEADATEDDTSSPEPTPAPSQKLFPSAHEVTKQVTKLVKAETVPFPSSRQTFSTAHDLLITLYVFAQFRGFAARRKSDVSDKH
ncbi:hypothetical protein Rt10032_c16g5752 [Rhodotorula toruloides]|uniref:Uncharacterized protein n=1 Tax=Rhodotorula toruloides TaxID=5286 RepID=A0A511KP69_RHOTO|nr:hypothetical protein Rt10032_c16g5752 [Rhodotorula toruloides]